MSAEVIQLATRRRQNRIKPFVIGSRPHYYCRHCDASHFTLLGCGEIRCGQCGARMNNIIVAAKN